MLEQVEQIVQKLKQKYSEAEKQFEKNSSLKKRGLELNNTNALMKYFAENEDIPVEFDEDGVPKMVQKDGYIPNLGIFLKAIEKSKKDPEVIMKAFCRVVSDIVGLKISTDKNIEEE